jgi:hypothetical protein
MAAWFQAIGSIVAISIAIWVPYKQKKDAALADSAKSQEDARRVCLAIRDELTFLKRLFTDGANVIALLNLSPGDIFEVTVPTVVPTDRFLIYRSVIDRLTMIDSDQLRQDIIWTYETAIGMIHMGLQNNRLLAEAHEARREHDIVRIDRHTEQLKVSAMNMQMLCKQTIERVNNLLPILSLAAGRA